MIISASRRTDIPSFYSKWFMNRLDEGYALIPNPRNANRLGHVNLTPENVDCIVFWTKNPIPMFDKFTRLTDMGYAYYMQFTLTPYDRTLEPGLPKDQLLQAFIEMSKQIGADRSVWRYDPILIDQIHTLQWHLKQFSSMCKRLENYTHRCVISFVDPYKSLDGKFRAMTQSEMLAIAEGFSKIAGQHGISLFTCAEDIDLSSFGIEHSACIDQGLIEKIIGSRIKAKIDANQRPACQCVESVDIGAYDTCSHGCLYCYATTSTKTVRKRVALHDPKSPLLTGYPRGDEIITDRTTESQKIKQLSFF